MNADMWKWKVVPRNLNPMVAFIEDANGVHLCCGKQFDTREANFIVDTHNAAVDAAIAATKEGK